MTDILGVDVSDYFLLIALATRLKAADNDLGDFYSCSYFVALVD